MMKEKLNLCERIRRLGYAQNHQVRLYGQIFDVISDPVSLGGNLVFVDARERKSGRLRRVMIPLNIVNMANEQRGVA